MDVQIANRFAEAWIRAWNNHDLDEILAHYADEPQFYSPFIPLLKFNEEGVITNKKDLRKYFETGLSTYPDLHFQLHNCLVGTNTLVLYYTSVDGRLAAEVFELNEQGKAIKVYCNYSEAGKP
jgi:ketosteroid isomerase-like protein